MRKCLIVSLLAASMMCVTPPALLAAVVSPNLPPGSQYQLVFVTAGSRDATSSDIADYNAFVNAEAALSPSLPTTTWHAVASTPTVNARDNAPSEGYPIYNTAGLRVDDPSHGAPLSLYWFSLLNPIEFNQFGNEADPINSSYVWTGTTWTGVINPNVPTLGDPSGTSAIGFPNATDSMWSYSGSERPSQEAWRLYALSDPITVPVPEPGSVTMLAIGIVALVGVRWRLRKQC